ncbi:MAG: hypothetical protein ACTS6G_03805 [Candidatus Hodgkinia cicadicola]
MLSLFRRSLRSHFGFLGSLMDFRTLRPSLTIGPNLILLTEEQSSTSPFD